MDLLGCAEIRPRLAAYYDGELSVEGQIAVDIHVMGCAAWSSVAGESGLEERPSRHGRGSRGHRGQPDERRARSVGQGSGRPAVRGYASGVGGTGGSYVSGLLHPPDRCNDVLHRAWPDGFARRDHDGHGLSRIQREPRAARSEHPSAPRSPGGGHAGDADQPTSWRYWRRQRRI